MSRRAAGRCLTAGLLLLPALNATSLGLAQNHRFPFRGESMKPGERVYAKDHAPGIQGEGEDFGVLRYLGSGNWSFFHDGTTGANNSDHVIYGKPVYAIEDGMIVGAWRNAPENANPPAHNPLFTDGYIPGGGNMLFVDQVDGKRVLYAHMQPGSIPAALCPNNEPLFPYPMTLPEGDAYLMLDPADQVPVQKGDFLGRVGNSGSSSGPHLHIHAEQNGAAATMAFEEGLYKPFVENNTDIQGGWASFAGQEVPDGEVLIRPARAVPYRMKDFEFYPAKKKGYAGIFEPGTHAPVALFETSWSAFLAKWQDIEKQGYRMKDFEVHQEGKKRVYAGIFEPGDFNPVALFTSDWSDFLATWQDIEAKGYRMKDLEICQHGAGLMYVGIFEPGSYPPVALFQGSWNEFVAGWQEIEAKGYRMKDFESFRKGNKQYYAGIFEPGKFAPVALFKNNWDEFLKGWQEIEKLGYRMKDLEIYRVGNGLMYAGIFEPGDFAPAALFHDKWNVFLEGWQNLE